MEAWNTVRILWLKVLALFTGKVFPGRLYETCALAHCRRRGYRVLRRNLQLTGGEIDLLAEDRKGSLVLIEVRGRANGTYLPRHTLPPAKTARLKRLSARLAIRYRRQVRIEFLEVIGELPKRTRFATQILAWWPEALGMKLTAFTLDET